MADSRFEVGFGRSLGFFRLFPPQDEDVADMLYRRTIQFCTDIGEKGLPIFPLDTMELDLDQFMGLERGVDFLQDRGRQTILSQAGNRVQMMGGGAERLALFGGQFNHDAYFRM